jgi:hypothetical protein
VGDLLKNKIVRSVLGIIAAFLLLLVISVVSWKYFEKQAERDVSNQRPDDFPVVVISPEKSELVFLKDIESYREQNPGTTFLIAPERLGLINSQLQADQAKRHGKGTPRIGAADLGGGRQLIDFEIIGDGLFRSKYEASTDSFRPVSLTVSGPGIMIVSCYVTLLAGVLAYILLRLLLWWSRRKRAAIKS